MTILGIDPGTGRCGYAVIRFTASRPAVLTHGVFEYPKTMALSDRLVLIERDVTALLDKYSPAAMAVETIIFNRNVTTAMAVSESRGVVVLCGAKRGLPIQPCSPLQVKLAITGYGRAEKKALRPIIQKKLKLSPPPKLDDAIDALAIALTGYGLLQKRSTQG